MELMEKIYLKAHRAELWRQALALHYINEYDVYEL